MRGLLATTDFDWYRHRSSLSNVDEVNSWQPSSYREGRIQPGEDLKIGVQA